MSRTPVSYGWTVVGAAALIVCFGMGALFSLGVFFKPIEESTGWTRSQISAIAALNWIFNGVGALVWGLLAGRYGSRLVAVLGGLLLGLGFVISSQVATLWHLYVAFGLLVGFASGAFYSPLAAAVTNWFVAKRGVAVGIVSAGMGLGTLVMAPIARILTDAFGWRGAMLLIGDMVWLVIVPAALLIRDADAPARAASPQAVGVDPNFTLAQVARAPQFWLIAATHFVCCAAHSGPLFHMVTHAIDQGVPPLPAATLLGIAGFTSILGRIALGAVGDRFGAKRVLVAGLALQALAMLLFLFVRSLGGFYALSVLFGIAYGGVMPLYALVLREYFGRKAITFAYGAVYGISSLGMGIGSFAGGWLYDVLGSYGWLFIGSTAIGAMAMALALTLTPPRSLDRHAVAVAT